VQTHLHTSSWLRIAAAIHRPKGVPIHPALAPFNAISIRAGGFVQGTGNRSLFLERSSPMMSFANDSSTLSIFSN
jgi:hypothetical protein